MKPAKLIVHLDEQKLEFLLDKESMSIGRGKTKKPDIMINEATISRLHARIFHQNDTFYLEDLSTFQRTYLNEKTLNEPIALKNQDAIRLGNIEATYVELEEGKLLYSESGTSVTIPAEMNKGVTQGIPVQLSESEEMLSDTGSQIQEAIYTGEQDLAPPQISEVSFDEETLPPEDNKEFLPPSPHEIPAPAFEDPEEQFKTASLHLDDLVEDAPVATTELDGLVLGEIPFATPVTTKFSKNVEPQLVCLTDGKQLAINKDAIYVGKEVGNDMTITSPYFASVQFSIIFNKKSSKFHLKHLGDYETHVNGVPIENLKELTGGSCITVGKHVFYFFDATNAQNFHSSLVAALNSAEERALANFPRKESKGLYLRGKLEYFFNMIVHEKKKSSAVLFHKQMEKGEYIFIGELYCEAAEPPPLYPYVVKIQGAFETSVDYGKKSLTIMETLNRNIYLHFRDFWMSGILLFLNDQGLKWVGACSNPILKYKANGECEYLLAPGAPLGTQRDFWAEEQEYAWQKQEKFFLITRNLFCSSLKTDSSLLANLDSISRLLKGIIAKQNSYSGIWEAFNSNLTERIDVNNNFAIMMLVQQEKERELICSSCNNTYPNTYQFCPIDGTALVTKD